MRRSLVSKGLVYGIVFLLVFVMFSGISMNVSAYVSHAPIVIDGNAQFTSANGVSSGSGTIDDPYIIENHDIDAGGVGSCIYILNTDAYFIIRSCYLHNSGTALYDSGIRLRYVDNGIIENNICEDNKYGVGILGSSNNLILKNKFESNDEGIFIYYQSYFNIIKNNVINENINYGIKVQYLCENNEIVQNLITNNPFGISFSVANNNEISNNDISYNTNFGISLDDATNNIICYNNIHDHEFKGLKIGYGDNYDNLIHHNNFINNLYHASDYGSNFWDDSYPSGGNYWDTYTGTDDFQGPDQDIPGSDGIGDTPRIVIDNNQDNYPLMASWEEPTPERGNTLVTLHQADSVIEFDSDGNIVWQITDLTRPVDAERLGNGNTLITEYLNGRVIEVDFNGDIVWEFDGLNAPWDAERLSNGNTLISDPSGYGIIEINPDGTIVWQKTGLMWPYDSEKLDSGNVLAIQQYPTDAIVELDSDGNIVWQFGISSTAFDVEGLPNDHSLITKVFADEVIEIDSFGNILWEFTDLDLPYDAERLDNGNTLIADTSNQRVIEVDHFGNIVWEISMYGYIVDVERIEISPLTPEEAIEAINEEIQELPDSAFTNNADNRKNAFNNKFDEVLEMIDDSDYEEAIDKLQNDIRKKCDGFLGGNPRNDWITDADAQMELCAMIDELVENLETLV